MFNHKNRYYCKACKRGKPLAAMYGEVRDHDQVRFEICDECWPTRNTPEKRRLAAVEEARALAMLVIFYLTAVWCSVPLVRAFMPGVKSNVALEVIAYVLAPFALLALASAVVTFGAWCMKIYRLLRGTVSTKDFE